MEAPNDKPPHGRAILKYCPEGPIGFHQWFHTACYRDDDVPRWCIEVVTYLRFFRGWTKLYWSVSAVCLLSDGRKSIAGISEHNASIFLKARDESHFVEVWRPADRNYIIDGQSVMAHKQHSIINDSKCGKPPIDREKILQNAYRYRIVELMTIALETFDWFFEMIAIASFKNSTVTNIVPNSLRRFVKMVLWFESSFNYNLRSFNLPPRYKIPLPSLATTPIPIVKP